jgi:hypothetical protein
MRRFFIILAATVFLAGPANAFSFQSDTNPSNDPTFWADIFVGYASVSSDVTVGLPNSALLRQNFPSSFFLQTIFSTSLGPVNSSTFNGAINQAVEGAGTQTQQVVITSKLIGFGPGGADDPIFTYTSSPGATIFTLTSGIATINPTLGSIDVLQQGSLLGGPATFNLSQNGSGLGGSFIFTDGSATRTIQFGASSDFSVIYLSPGVSAVPLPPALPMFASALLALGIFGFVARKKRLRQAADVAETAEIEKI